MTFLINSSGQSSLLTPKLDYIELTAFPLNLKIGALKARNKDDFKELSLSIQDGDSGLFSDPVLMIGMNPPFSKSSACQQKLLGI